VNLEWPEPGWKPVRAQSVRIVTAALLQWKVNANGEAAPFEAGA
jgi:hypothetical protein